MTAQQFLNLDQAGKLALVHAMDHHSERYEPDYTILLFYMDGWILEAYYHRKAGFNHFRASGAGQDSFSLRLPEASATPFWLQNVQLKMQQWMTGLVFRRSGLRSR